MALKIVLVLEYNHLVFLKVQLSIQSSISRAHSFIYQNTMYGESGTLGLLVVLRAIRVLPSDLENAYLERMEGEIALKIIILIIMITE